MGEGMSEEQLKALVQQTTWATVWFAVALVLALYLTSVAPDGRRQWSVWRDRIRGWLPARTARVEEEPDEEPDRADSAPRRQTDRQTDRTAPASSPLFAAALNLEVDRSRKAVARALVAAGWGVGEIRSVLKGDNKAIGDEVREVQEAEGLPPPPRQVDVHGQIEARVELPTRR